MEFQFPDFDAAHFRAEPRRTDVGGWTVQHLSFGMPETLDRPPLMFIGGAFQNAWSFLREVRHFLPQRPVILVDLPGQGQNNQLSEQLRFADFADVLRGFLDAVGLDRIVPVGLSYGSGIAYSFAQRFPERVERLILGGTTDQIRPRVHQALRSSFWYFDHGRHDKFADSVIHHLLNLAHREVTGVGDRLVESLRLGMLELTDVERLRYRHNSTRLFTDRLSGPLACRTLVFSATFDHFTAPFEGLALARQSPSAEFVMIERGDHLVPVESPKLLLALYDAFLNDRPLADVSGVLTGQAAVYAARERRLLDRRAGRGREIRLCAPDGREATGALIDYNAHGCLFSWSNGALRPEGDGPMRVTIPAIGADADAVVMPDERGARAVFLQDAFNTLGKMPVETVELPVPGRRISIAQRIAELPEE